MSETTSQIDNPNYLGIDAKLVAQTERKGKSGIRLLRGEVDPLKHISTKRILGETVYEQDLLDGASSSIWKEYLEDKKQFTGVLLSNNTLIWFDTHKFLTLPTVDLFVKTQNPDLKIEAEFFIGEKGKGSMTTDIQINSLSENGDKGADKLMEYFGKSLDFNENYSVGVNYTNNQKPQFNGSLQEYLFLEK